MFYLAYLYFLSSLEPGAKGSFYEELQDIGSKELPAGRAYTYTSDSTKATCVKS